MDLAAPALPCTSEDHYSCVAKLKCISVLIIIFFQIYIGYMPRSCAVRSIQIGVYVLQPVTFVSKYFFEIRKKMPRVL